MKSNLLVGCQYPFSKTVLLLRRKISGRSLEALKAMKKLANNELRVDSEFNCENEILTPCEFKNRRIMSTDISIRISTKSEFSRKAVNNSGYCKTDTGIVLQLNFDPYWYSKLNFLINNLNLEPHLTLNSDNIRKGTIENLDNLSF